jgi:hypothetical protein
MLPATVSSCQSLNFPSRKGRSLSVFHKKEKEASLQGKQRSKGEEW